MTYVIDPNAEEPIMLIDTHIGMDEEDGIGVMGGEFARELLFLDTLGKKKIHIWINSLGGNVLEGMKIYSAMLKTKTKVYTHNCGLAASIAAVIFEGGYKKIMADYSWLMFHDAFDPTNDKLDEAAKADLDRINASIATMVAKRIGKTDVEVRAIMSRTTWMDAAEAQGLGFCDEIESSDEMNKPRFVPSEAKASWKAANEVLKKAVNKFSNIPTTMKSVANFLKLNESASEAAVLEEVTKLKNSAAASDKKVAEIETECKNMKDALAKKEEELKNFKEEQEKKEKAAKDAKDVADMADAQNKAKDLVEAAVRAGVLKNEADEIKDWTARGVKDYADTKKILDKMSGNKAGIDIQKAANKEGEKKFGSVIAMTMHENRAKLKI